MNSFSSGVYAPPRRSEFAFVRVKIFEKNYLEKNKIVFNSYKTTKKYESQIYEVLPLPLVSILKKYLKLNKSEKYKNIPSLVDMEKTAEAMGHTVSTILEIYVEKE